MAEPARPSNENLITLPQAKEREKFSGNDAADGWLIGQIMALGEVFGEGLTAERQAIYAEALSDIPVDQLRHALGRAIRELKWFPKVAELRELAGLLPGAFTDGRPGPEEAWARMPKGDRMAFKERYEKELAEARSQRRPVRWAVSVGYDMEHRLSTLAAAVTEKRLTLHAALNFVSGERLSDFAQMLPSSEGKGLITGEVKKLPNLPGLTGILAKMQMEGTVPEELKVKPRSPYKNRSPEEWRELRERAKAQVDFVNRSRNGSGNEIA